LVPSVEGKSVEAQSLEKKKVGMVRTAKKGCGVDRSSKGEDGGVGEKGPCTYK